MRQELSEQGMASVLEHHSLQTTASLKELAKRSGLIKPLLLPALPLYQSIALMLALLSFDGVFTAEPILPFRGMPSGDLALVALLAILGHSLKRSWQTGLLAFALMLAISFIMPLQSPLLMVIAALSLIYGMLVNASNQVRMETFRSKALKRIFYREERARRIVQEIEERERQESHVAELMWQDRVSTSDETESFDLGPLQAYEDDTKLDFAH